MKSIFSTAIFRLVYYFNLFLLSIVLQACKSEIDNEESLDKPNNFRVEGSQILNGNQAVTYLWSECFTNLWA